MSQPLEPDHQDEEHSYQERVEKLAMMTVGVTKGIVPSGQITLLMHQIANGTVAPPEIRAFTQVLLQIIQGERNPDVGNHLPEPLAQVVQETIAQIEAPLPEPEPDQVQAEGLTLLELLERVGEACTGNAGLWQQLWNFTEQLESAPTTPPEIRELAVVLRKILAGERQQHVLDDLPADLAEPVAHLLEQLLAQSAVPPGA